MPNSNKGITRLSELEPGEVSLVPQGANRRRFLVRKKAEDDVGKVKKKDLSTQGRKHIADSNFALPGERKYPIHDISHARNALARASGKPEEAKVKAAVYRKYPSLKPEGDGVKKSAEDKVKKKIAKGDPETMQRVDDCVKSYMHKDVDENGEDMDGDNDKYASAGELDDAAHAAIKAAARILTPFKDKIPGPLMHQVVSAVGYDDEEPGESDESGATHEGDGTQHGDDEGFKQACFAALPAKVESEKDDFLEGTEVKKGDLHSAAEAANAAYHEHMEKLGYRMYPDAEMAMKTKDGSSVMKTKGEPVSKAAPDLSQVDAKTRETVEHIFKSNAELVQKNADLTKRLDERDAADRKREIVAKAASWTHLGLPQDDVVANLVDADKAGKEAFERICKSYDALNTQGKASRTFSEIGYASGGAASGGAGDWSKIEAAARNWVQKSGEKLTDAQGMEAFLRSPEGQRMYGEYKAQRPGGI